MLRKLRITTYIVALVVLIPAAWKKFDVVSMTDVLESEEIAESLRREFGRELNFDRKPRQRFHRVTIWEVQDLDRQDEILAYLESSRESAGWNSIHVEFYEEKILHRRETEGGFEYLQQGEETLLREERVGGHFWH